MKCIDVAGVEFELVYDNINKPDDNMGMSSLKEGKIYINSCLPEQLKEQTLIHEWVHMILDNYGFDESTNEKLVCTLANELYRSGFKIKIKEK